MIFIKFSFVTRQRDMLKNEKKWKNEWKMKKRKMSTRMSFSEESHLYTDEVRIKHWK